MEQNAYVTRALVVLLAEVVRIQENTMIIDYWLLEEIDPNANLEFDPTTNDDDNIRQQLKRSMKQLSIARG